MGTTANGLHLNITEFDNRLNFDLAMEVIVYFRISSVRAEEILGDVRQAVSQWRKKSDTLGINRAEQERMAQAFNIKF